MDLKIENKDINKEKILNCIQLLYLSKLCPSFHLTVRRSIPLSIGSYSSINKFPIN